MERCLDPTHFGAVGVSLLMGLDLWILPLVPLVIMGVSLGRVGCVIVCNQVEYPAPLLNNAICVDVSLPLGLNLWIPPLVPLVTA